MIRVLTITLTVLLLMIPRAAICSIIDLKILEIDLTDPHRISELATLSYPDLITVTGTGLGWDGDAASSVSGWLITQPLALGLSWRAPNSVSITVSIEPGARTITLNSGQEYKPYDGDVYVRYSPDLQNWSTWQIIPQMECTEGDLPSDRSYRGMLRIPQLELDDYYGLLSLYAELDVPWKSDEEAAVQWILDRDPDYFEEHLPLIGYVQFLYETSFYGGQRLTSFRAEVSYGMSGLHYPPDDESVYEERDASPWSFTGSQAIF